MDLLVLGVFAVVYLGMIAGELPGLALDRTGVALVGAILLIALGRMSPLDAWSAIDVPTLGLLFGLMVVSAQFRLGGFYARFTEHLSALRVSPPMLLGLIVAAAGALSSLLCNDIICLAMAPLLLQGCRQRRLDPVPFLLALACAANVGSAATLIGNPQNMLIGQVLRLRFDTYLWQAVPPTLLSLVLVWLIIVWRVRGSWTVESDFEPVEVPPFDAWQTWKGFLVLAALVIAFLVGRWPREAVALTAAGVLVVSRRVASRRMLQLVDWQLLVLFSGLFIVHGAMEATGNLSRLMGWSKAWGIDPTQPAVLFVVSVLLSNLVSNVPATMLLLPSATHELAGPILALSSTFAGNLLVVGSIANIIVIDQARLGGVEINWRQHARIGIPVTIATLLVAAAWLLLTAQTTASL